MSLPQNLDKFATLVAIIARLRSAEGCPWDREQTHRSLRKNLLEESYEVLEALDRGDSAELCEELGDLLLQIILHTQIATEAGEFELGDVLRGINTKLIRRHPHVFGALKVKDAAEVTRNWGIIKQEERGAGGSTLAGVAEGMPALGYSQAIQQRAAQLGLNVENGAEITDRVEELKQAGSSEERASRFGDLLFALADLARQQGIDLESALRETNHRFYKWVSYLEEACRKQGLSLSELSVDEKKALWEEAKNR
ncbi:MAG: nucleoside triphosphate pyrophosphohydrolase [Dehalococcoidales bacterium]|nr:nucleoside triphosphate pyrophosphohydrolase [Dehalococcoidales bacterium]